VDDRLSFRRFCDLPLDRGVADHSTIWRFRQELEHLGLSEALFAEIKRQLDARGVIVRKGTLIDATIVAAAVTPPLGKEAEVSARSSGRLDQKERQGPVRLQGPHRRSTRAAASSVAPSCPALTCMTARPDRPWSGATRRAAMPTKPMTAGNSETPWPQPESPTASCTRRRNTPLKDWQRWFNKAVAPIRSGVEHASPL
jgi:IS5 family transposase